MVTDVHARREQSKRTLETKYADIIATIEQQINEAVLQGDTAVSIEIQDRLVSCCLARLYRLYGFVTFEYDKRLEIIWRIDNQD